MKKTRFTTEQIIAILRFDQTDDVVGRNTIRTPMLRRL